MEEKCSRCNGPVNDNTQDCPTCGHGVREERLEAKIAMLEGAICGWRNIVDQLPKTADNITIFPGMTIFYKGMGGIIKTKAIAIEKNRIRASGDDYDYLGMIVSADKCYANKNKIN